MIGPCKPGLLGLSPLSNPQEGLTKDTRPTANEEIRKAGLPQNQLMKSWEKSALYSFPTAAKRRLLLPLVARALHWRLGRDLQLHYCSVPQSCPTLCDPMDFSTPGLPVHHQLLEFTQTHVHRVGDIIQPSHPLSSPSPPAFNLSQHQSFPRSQFFTSGGQNIGASPSASVLPMNIQD